MTDLARVAALIDACRRDGGRLPPGPAVMLLTLWDAKGRTVPLSVIEDATSALLLRDPHSLSTVPSGLKRARRAIETAGWPIKIKAVTGVGYWLGVPDGWMWGRDAHEDRVWGDPVV